MREKKNGSIYVCHTYYHVYVSMLKEFAKQTDEQGNATIVLSTMSTQFENLKERLLALNYFNAVYEFDEQAPETIDGLELYHRKTKNFFLAMANRVKYTKMVARAQEQYIPVDFSTYENVYVFCDSDPIGYYLNYKHIYYHAEEDGLNTLAGSDLARVDNEGHFGLKVFLSKKLNLIFIQNGYGKYCLDMEVNDNAILKYPCPYRIEVSRKALEERLTFEEKQVFLKAFVKNIESINNLLFNKGRKTVMLLTEPLCDLDTRKRIFRDMVDRYKDEYDILIKQHPRDYMNYEEGFEDCTLIDRTVPMEMLDFIENFQVDLVVAVFTRIDNLKFAKEKLRLERDYMDQYEDPEIHKSRFESK